MSALDIATQDAHTGMRSFAEEGPGKATFR